MPDIKPIQPKFHLQVLNADQLQAIKSATLHLLEQVGVKFPSEKALAVFAEHGARVDLDRQIVRLPPELVTEAMSRATTKTGLQVFVSLLDKEYQTGNSATEGFKEHMEIVFDRELPQWNYRAIPSIA